METERGREGPLARRRGWGGRPRWPDTNPLLHSLTHKKRTHTRSLKHVWSTPHSNCQPEPEAGTQPDEVGSGGLAVAGRAQTEEGVVLHGALPQVLAGARAVQPEHEGVLLLTPLGEEAKVLVGAHVMPASGSKEDTGKQDLPGRHPPLPRGSVCSF